MTGSAKQSIAQQGSKNGLLRRCAPRNDVAISRREAPEVCQERPALPITEGAGKAGCPLHPQPRVRNKKAHEHSHYRFTGVTRPSLRNGFNGLYRALPGDRLFDSHILEPKSSPVFDAAEGFEA
jgi:hypothetical protein